ncbi:MAG: hypothetical protein Q4B72_15710, partial [Lachnospiraceae bacterium]|nr:hypothetical protein [Lachnospiraceae bacterium]
CLPKLRNWCCPCRSYISLVYSEERKKPGCPGEGEHMVRNTDLFTEKEYEELKKFEGRTETESYRGPVIDDLVVEIIHRVHRLDPDRMIYIVNLNFDKVQNLFNDDLYWRAEPVKFCHGIPTLQEIQQAIQKQLDYLNDVPPSKSKVLNIEWDPKAPDFDS